MSDGDKFYTMDEGSTDKEVYEIKLIAEDNYEDESAYRLKEEDHLVETFEEEELTYEELLEPDQKSVEEEYAACETDVVQEDLLEVTEELQPEQTSRPTNDTESPKLVQSTASSSSPVRNITDPNERYLMSCLPAFNRFTPQQQAYVRMGIERLFYEVEFEGVSEPKNKKTRTS